MSLFRPQKIAFRILAILFLVFSIYSFINFYSDLEVEILKKEFTYPDSKFINISGMDVHYRIIGQGKPLVLLHGTGASLHTWEEWGKILSNDFKVITLDLPAFGLTGPHFNNDYSIKAYSSFLDDFSNQIGLDSFALAGNSLGGRIAWAFALDQPEKVKQLILLDAAGFPNIEKSPPLAFQLAKNSVFDFAIACASAFSFSN